LIEEDTSEKTAKEFRTMVSKTTPDQALSDQYTNDRNLLSAMIVERDQLLRELEGLAHAPQGKGTPERFIRFDVAKAQSFLFELSKTVNRIDTLIVQINSYAERCDMPLVGLEYREE
jgi:hypothetical protein